MLHRFRQSINLCLLLLLLPSFKAVAEQPDFNAFVNESRDIATKFKTSLVRRCDMEIKTVGLHVANEVCRMGYKQMYYEYSVKNNIIMKLVSLTPRNIVDGHPDAWEQDGLLKLKAAIKKGKDINKMEISGIADEPIATYYRYLQPLVATPFCIQCHGKNTGLNQETTSWMGAWYPRDKAMGYSVGDFMGAISIKKEVKPKNVNK